MGWFSSTAYSTKEYEISSEKIRALVSRNKVPSLTPEQEELIEDAIREKRHGDGKISLQQVYEVLSSLKHQGLISDSDRSGVMQVFKRHFG